MKLSDADAIATVAVKDAGEAKKFYGDTLGLKLVDENPASLTYQSGKNKIFVYPSPTAGSGQATAITWHVEDIAGVVTELKDKGVKFEDYDIPGATKEGDVMVMGPFKAAWFKDPDGNVLSLGEGK